MKFLTLLILNPLLFFKKLYRKLINIYKIYISKDEYAIEVSRWFKDKGDQTLRYDYPLLDENSIVFDLGGYVGDFAYGINKKYGCKVYLFEPHPEYYNICKKRFLSNKKITTLNFGLSNSEGKFILSDSFDGSSFLNPNHNKEGGINCNVKEFFNVLIELNVRKIDLMKINIEGGEYPLLSHIAKNDKLDVVNDYQIQFHNFITNAKTKRERILQSLTKTHQRTWCYNFVWENWKKL